MFADDKSIDNLRQLLEEFRSYLKLQKRYTQLELTEKMSILLSTLMLVLLIVILSMVALFYLSFTIAYLLEPYVGGLMESFSLVAIFYLSVIAAILLFRKKVIIRPITLFVVSLFEENRDKITPDNLHRQKEETLKEVRHRQQSMHRRYHNLFTPLDTATSNSASLLKAANLGMALFDGISFGIKFMKKARKASV